MPGSCSNGLRSRPLAAAGRSLTKGFDVTRVNKIVPTLIKPITPSVLARTGCGRCLENIATAQLQPANMSAQSNIEPSWLPHEAQIR